MEEETDFDRAVKNFRSHKEDLWKEEMSNIEYACHVFRSMTWTEVVTNVLAVVSIAIVAFGLLLFG